MKIKSFIVPVVILGSCMLCLSLPSCTAVKPYQKMYVNDSEMELNAKRIEKFELNFKSYREGATGGTGGKSSGGCGCN